MKQLSSESVVANTIRLTELLLLKKQVNWKDARDGVEFIKESLARRWPADAVMIRGKFDTWIDAWETRSALVLPFDRAHTTGARRAKC